jgi:DNA-binding LacI/PurR family transcriptional regulator
MEAAYRNACALLDRDERPTALLAASDEMAIGALRAAAERGIDIPGRLSIVESDDTPPAAWSAPGLTTVRQPHHEKGRMAAEYLLGPRDREDVVPRRTGHPQLDRVGPSITVSMDRAARPPLAQPVDLGSAEL